MNVLEELKIHIDAIASVVEKKPTLFAPIIVYIDQLKELIKSPSEEINQEDFNILARKIEEFYAKWRRKPNSHYSYFPPREIDNSDSIVGEINHLVEIITKLDEISFKSLFPLKKVQTFHKVDANTVSIPCIFIGHGRSKLWALLKIFIENKLGIKTIEYESESRVGDSIIPILEKMLDQAAFAVILLTAEDETKDGSIRARQNVIHEAGLFQGRLGFKRAVILMQEGLEDFSNIAGLQYISFDGDQIEQTFYELQQVLKREKMLQ